MKDEKTCEDGSVHDFEFSRNDSFYRSAGRNSICYECHDYFHCRKCLCERIVSKTHECMDDTRPYALPEWCRAITRKVGGF